MHQIISIIILIYWLLINLRRYRKRTTNLRAFIDIFSHYSWQKKLHRISLILLKMMSRNTIVIGQKSKNTKGKDIFWDKGTKLIRLLKCPFSRNFLSNKLKLWTNIIRWRLRKKYFKNRLSEKSNHYLKKRLFLLKKMLKSKRILTIGKI